MAAAWKTSFWIHLIRRRIPLAVAALLTLALLADQSVAQNRPQSRVVPRDEYFLVFSALHEGEFQDALRGFNSVSKGGIRSTEGRWVDSICYHTMMGECYYQIGQLGNALDQYNAALNLFLVHRHWMLRIQFPETILPSANMARARITWGGSSRRTQLGRFPDVMSSSQGRADNLDVLKQGGVMMGQVAFPLRVQEIVRCTCLALRRRRELMGPACPHDQMTAALVDALSRRPAPVNHWSQAWISVQLGLAYAGAGKNTEAVTELQKGLMVLGSFDHPMTDVALLELGKLAFEQGHYDSAKNFFLESTFSAAQFGHATIIQEGFRGALITHLVSGKPGIFPELTRAHPFARSQGFRHLEVLLRIMAAESHAFAGQTPQALAFLDEARVRMGRRDMAAGATGAYFNYQLALANFQKGDLKTGSAALAQTMAYQKKGSRWLLQIAIADKLYTSGAVSPRVGEMLYKVVLREPAAADWSVDPMETLSVVLAPRDIPMEHWFLLTLLQRKEHEEALEIADRVRRQRFYSSLPMGGRLLALRWILEAPKDALSDAALLQRQDLLVKYPKYAGSSRAATAIRDELRKLPAVPADDGELRQQKDLLTKLAAETAAQELILRAIALRRDPSEFVFPPLKKTAEIKESLTDGQLAIAFFATSRAVYAFIFTRDKYNYWQVESPTKIREQVIEMLKGMGHYSKDRAFTAGDLADQSWKEPAAEVLSLLMNRHKGDFWGKYDELIIVPDGALWYVPFEALQVPTSTGDTVPLISKIRVRLAPTASLITPDDRSWKPVGTTAVVVGKMVPRVDQAVAMEAFDELRLVDPSSVAITEKLPAPSSLVKTLWDRLVVLDDVDDAARVPYDWTPAQIDLGKFGSTLGSWLQLPWGGPEQVILPGFHSVAEEGLKRSHGQEIFLTVCGMMATGARTVLISRWRVGGQTDFDLVREFLQELPHVEASAAWRRAVALARSNPVDPTREPRLKLNLVDEPPKASHPLFWAGYLLADTGSDPAAKSAADAAAAAAGP